MAATGTNQLGAPGRASVVQGEFALHQFVRSDPTVAAPVVWEDMSYIQNITVGEPSFDTTFDVFQQGGGDEKTQVKRGPKWEGSIEVLPGKIGEVIAQLQGVTWGSAQNVLSLRAEKDIPDVCIQSWMRDMDNTTHLYTQVLQDIIIDDMGIDSPMGLSNRTIPFHTYHEPFLLYTGKYMILDAFTATPSTGTYTLSGGTPATLLTASNHDDWHIDNAVFVKNKDDSASNETGVRRTSGIAISGETLTFSTDLPAASDKITVLYADATS